MTEPSTEPTFTPLVDEQAPEAEEAPLVPSAPGYVAITAHVGAPAVTIQWGPPVDGPADSYTVEAAGQTYEADGDTFAVNLGGLTAGEDVSATVTAHVGDESGSLSAGPVPVNQPNDPPQEG